MSGDRDWELIRTEVVRLGRKSSTRRNDWSRDVPCDWAPNSVHNPMTEMPFSDDSAWELICDLIERGHEFNPKELEKPPGAIAYETTVRLRSDLPLIYIKVQLRHGKAWGRSFHNDLRRN